MDIILEEEPVQINDLSFKLAEFKKSIDNFLEARSPEHAHNVVLASSAALQELYDIALINYEMVRFNRKGIAEFCGYSQFVLSALHAKHPLSKIEKYYAAQITSQISLASELLVNGVRAYEKRNLTVNDVLGRVMDALPSPERKP